MRRDGETEEREEDTERDEEGKCKERKRNERFFLFHGDSLQCWVELTSWKNKSQTTSTLFNTKLNMLNLHNLSA